MNIPKSTYKFTVNRLSNIFTQARTCFGPDDLIIELNSTYNKETDVYDCVAVAIEEPNVNQYLGIKEGE